MKKAVGGNQKIASVGSVMTLDNAEEILSRGLVDFVAMARPFVADPEFMRKAAKGQNAEIRPCVRCNTCCGRSAFFKKTRCAVNPINGRETDFPTGRVGRAEEAKKVVIVGGGAAGMQAAITATQRGHRVVLFEKEAVLGGTLNHATDLAFKKDLQNFLHWIVDQTLACGADIRLGTEATPEAILAEQPDALLLAVGATPFIPNVPGIDMPHVHWAGDVDCGRVPVGQKVVVVGGGLTGAETALSLAMQGKDVTIVEMMGPEALLNGASLINKFSLQSLLMQHHVRIIPHTKLEAVTEKGIRTINNRFQWQDFEADTVALALGMRPRRDTVAALRDLLPATEVYDIGDCHQIGTVYAAVHAGFDTAVAL